MNTARRSPNQNKEGEVNHEILEIPEREAKAKGRQDFLVRTWMPLFPGSFRVFRGLKVFAERSARLTTNGLDRRGFPRLRGSRRPCRAVAALAKGEGGSDQNFRFSHCSPVGPVLPRRPEISASASAAPQADRLPPPVSAYQLFSISPFLFVAPYPGQF